MKFTALFLFTLFFTLLACKDKDKTIAKSYCEENPGGCESVMEAKKYFAFKLGSWWVYEEETSGERDSVYVIQSYIDQNSYDFDIRVRSTIQNFEYHFWPVYVSPNGCSLINPVKKKCVFINRSKGKSGEFIGQDYCFFINHVKGDYETLGGNIFFQNNKIFVEEIYESYTINNYAFNKTLKINELNSVVEGYQPTNHYFSKNVGLIRKELLDSNQVWNLVNYHIEP